MTTIKEYQERLHQENYRFEVQPDDKIHVLYLGAKFNSKSYYRMLAPALELNKTNTHKAIISTIGTHDFGRKYAMDCLQVEEYLIRWADYIVFPAVMECIDYLIKAVRSINPKVKIVMDIDRNYFEISNESALLKKVKPDNLKQLLVNLGLVDFLTVSSESLKSDIEEYLTKQSSIESPIINYTPNLLSRFGYEEVQRIQKNENSKIRVGLFKPSPKELGFLRRIADDLPINIINQIQFVCFGKSMFTEQDNLLLKELKVEFHSTVGFADYFNKLNDLRLDIVLLITENSQLNREQIAYIYLEVCSFGIPSIMYKHTAKNNTVEDNETGVIADSLSQWSSTLIKLVTNKSNRRTIGNASFGEVWENRSFNTVNLKQFTNVFK